MKLFTSLLLLAFLLNAACCTNNKTQQANISADTAPGKKIAVVENKKTKKPTITYYSFVLTDSVITNIKSIFTLKEMEIILALNRLDWSHLRKGDTLLVPDTFFTDLNIYSPFPDSLTEINQLKKMIMVSYYAEAFAAYQNGKLIRWGPASLGKRSTPTPGGLFFTNWKSKETTSTINEEWKMKWYFNIDNFEGVSIHQYDLPGYPASHSCVRLNADDALWIYNWADQWKIGPDNETILVYGTPVIIFGSYQFDQAPCWKNLSINSSNCNVPLDSLMREINHFLPTIIERQVNRDTLNLL